MELDNANQLPIPRINGNMLANYVDKEVLLVAELISIENLKMKIKCCDGPLILAHLKEAVGQHLAPNTKIQVLATVKSRHSIQCNDFIVLTDNADDFDLTLYNEAIKMLAEQEEMNNYLINNVEEHWGADNEKELNLIDVPEPAKIINGVAATESQSQSGNRNDGGFY